MAFRTTYTRIGDLVIEHKIEAPDAPAASPVAEEPKPKKTRRTKAKADEPAGNDSGISAGDVPGSDDD